MGALFAWGAGAGDLAAASPDAIATGVRLTFAAALALVALALAVSLRAAPR
jgi:hypothetical protein